MEENSNTYSYNTDIDLLKNKKEATRNYRQRRSEDWRENYTLYRDRVQINRLTQRQSVNIPIMKQTIRTLLKDVDDMPALYFENLDNDKQKEVFLNEYWKWTVESNKMDLKDIVDKRQVFLFGRTFDQMQIANGRVKIGIVDPEDIGISRYVDPTDIDTARDLVHSHIYTPLRIIEENEEYNKEAISNLKLWHSTDEGLVKVKDNLNEYNEKNQRMMDMGDTDVEDPMLGETIIELTLYFTYRKEEDDEEEQLYLYVVADDMQILMKKPLEEVIGVTKDHYWRNHFPYNSWADDVDNQDFWTDGIADIVRTPNKVLNAWYSQLVENRTLRNFGMHYYNSSLEGFVPQTYQPMPWGWYGIPVGENGQISQAIQKVDIPDLSESLDEIQYVVTMIEKATGATATQQGTQTERNITLGEVELALGEAKERVKGMSKFYTPAWKARGEKFLKLIEAAPDKLDAVKVYKKGRNTNNIYGMEISPDNWESESGYQTRVWSLDEKDAKNTQDLERMNAVKTNMPDNPVVDKVYKRKLVEFADFTPEEVNDAMKFEEEKTKALLAAGMGGMGAPPPMGAPAPQPQPQQPVVQ